jgi:hypothetical protein
MLFLETMVPTSCDVGYTYYVGYRRLGNCSGLFSNMGHDYAVGFADSCCFWNMVPTSCDVGYTDGVGCRRLRESNSVPTSWDVGYTHDVGCP